MDGKTPWTDSPSRGPVPTITGYPFYEHLALPSLDGHTRLLILDPGTGDDPLSGSMTTTRVEDSSEPGPYEAISYAWGSPVRDKWIMIDGKQLPITTSIADALRQTRRPGQPRTLWADSICINQEDDEERGEQVSLMGRIYAMSRCTLICLGPGPGFEQNARDVKALISEVNEMMDRVFEDPEFSWDWDGFPYPQADNPLLTATKWQSWIELVHQAWFRRGWVVQEAALGRDGVVLWAGVEMSWISILRAEYWLTWRAQHLMPTLVDWWLAEIHSRMYALRRPKEARTFRPELVSDRLKAMATLEMLDVVRPLGLTDAKDRIYAFMALPTSDGAMPALQPDYGKETSHLDVYREFAIKYLDKTSDLGLLSFVKRDSGEDLASSSSSSSSFASWVPRWDRGDNVVSLFGPAHRKLEDTTSRHRNEPDFTIVQGSLALRVRAVIIDSVKHVSKIIEWRAESPAQQVEQVVSLWRDAAAPSARYPGPHESRRGTAVLNALCLGKYDGERDEWNQSERAFANLLQSESESESLSELASPHRPIGDTYTHDRNAQRVSAVTTEVSHNRRLILLGRGYFGNAPQDTREGDVCAIIFGTRYPSILRKVADKGDHYRVVGAAYVQSKECSEEGFPFRLGDDDDCDDWRDWNLPTEEIILC